MPARYPRGRRQRGNIFIALPEEEVRANKTDIGEKGRRKGDEREKDIFVVTVARGLLMSLILSLPRKKRKRRERKERRVKKRREREKEKKRPTSEGAKCAVRREEEELRVIEKPVVHPDGRFISRAHAQRCTRRFSPIISPFCRAHRLPLLSLSHPFSTLE